MEELNGMEGGDGGPEVGVWTVSDVIELDEARAHYEDALQDVESGERDLYILEDAHEKLTDMVVSTEALLAAGGLTQSAAFALSHRMSATYNRIGLEGLVETKFPSMESFGSTDSRVSATNVALEDLKEKVKAIGKAIFEKLKQVIAFITDFIGTVLKSLGTLKKRAQALLKEAKSKTKAKDGAKMPNYNGGAVAFDGRSDAPNIIKGLEATAKNVAGFLEDAEVIQEKIGKTSLKDVADYTEAEYNTDVNELSKAFTGDKLNTKIIGGVTTGVKDGKIFVSRTGGNIPGDSNLPSLGQIEDIINKVVDLIGVLESKKTTLDKLKTINANMSNRAKDIDKASSRFVVKLFLYSVRQGVSGHCTRLCNYAYTGASAALGYAEKALKQYE